jgi:ABC-type sugar transport system substrate-binding protein
MTTTTRRAMTRVAALAGMVMAMPARAADSLYDLTVMQYGKPTPLSAYRGKVVVVNVASE